MVYRNYNNENQKRNQNLNLIQQNLILVKGKGIGNTEWELKYYRLKKHDTGLFN